MQDRIPNPLLIASIYDYITPSMEYSSIKKFPIWGYIKTYVYYLMDDEEQTGDIWLYFKYEKSGKLTVEYEEYFQDSIIEDIKEDILYMINKKLNQ